MFFNSLSVSFYDLYGSFRKVHLITTLGWNDVRQRYRRSKVGPFWLTISMGVMIATIGLVFGKLFNNPMKEFLPFLSCGIILWAFLSSVLNEACFSYINEERVIKQIALPYSMYPLRVLWRNIIIFLHNIIILPIVYIAVGKGINAYFLLSFVGFILFVLNLTWISILFSIICTRFRDLPQIINSILQILYFVTPIIWMPHSMQQKFGMTIVNLNPVYHIIEVVRAPLLGNTPSLMNYQVTIGVCIIGWLLALTAFGFYKRRISYWL